MKKFLKYIAGYIIPYNAYMFLSRHKIMIKRILRLDKTNFAKNNKIGKYWAKFEQSVAKNPKEHWSQSEFAAKYINMWVANSNSTILSEGANQLLIQRLCGRRLKQGVSVGCGNGLKELRLLQLDIVEKFIFFELSGEHARIINDNIKNANLVDRVEIHISDAFKHDFNNIEVDLVHWNNSLHHMFDVQAAVKWSYNILSTGGIFYMDDYVGPNRFQYPENVINVVNEIRDSLPHKYLKNPHDNSLYYGRYINCDPNMFEIEGGDPSEAVDSERILESIKNIFPKAEITLTGGIIYAIALSGLWENFDEENDNDISVLNRLLDMDKKYAQDKNFKSLYAVSIAIK